MTNTLSALYNTHQEAEAVIRDLEAAGFDHDRISILSKNADGRYQNTGATESEAGKGAGSGAVGGAVVGVGAGLLAGLGMLAIPGIGPVVAAGWLASTAIGAAAGAVVGGASGGLIGLMVRHGIAEDDAHVYAEGVRRGGSLVTVKADDDEVSVAEGILRRAGWVDAADRRATYRQEGWVHFDERAPPPNASTIIVGNRGLSH